MFTDEQITEKAKQMKRAYKREWAKKNRDKVNASIERYWLNRAKKELTREEVEKTW